MGESRLGMFARGFDEGFDSGLAPEQFDLPHPPVHVRIMLLLHEVLGAAIEMLRLKNGSLATFGEDSITAELYHFLENDLRHRKARGMPNAIPGFDEQMFDAVIRHPGVTDYTGTRLKVEPDLCFKLKPSHGLRVLPTEYAIFTECKPVDADHPAGSRCCDAGLNRFVNGDYAWAMQDALMVGYTRHRTIPKHLTPALRNTERRRQLKVTKLPLSISGKSIKGGEALHMSVHSRGFPWSWNKGSATEIRVYHSWHECT